MKALAHSSDTDGAVQAKRAVNYALPLFASVATGFLLAPYASTIARYCFPYAYTLYTGTSPDDLSYFYYGTVYLQTREHFASLAYQNAYPVCMGTALAAYYIASVTYSISNAVIGTTTNVLYSLGSSLYSFFSGPTDESQDKQKKDNPRLPVPL